VIINSRMDYGGKRREMADNLKNPNVGLVQWLKW
jgi:hypothetical protein